MQVTSTVVWGRAARAVVCDENRAEKSNVLCRRIESQPSSPTGWDMNIRPRHGTWESSRNTRPELTRWDIEGQTSRNTRIVVKISKDVTEWICLTEQASSKPVENQLRIVRTIQTIRWAGQTGDRDDVRNSTVVSNRTVKDQGCSG